MLASVELKKRENRDDIDFFLQIAKSRLFNMFKGTFLPKELLNFVSNSRARHRHLFLVNKIYPDTNNTTRYVTVHL
jgi:hypothetical protein